MQFQQIRLIKQVTKVVETGFFRRIFGAPDIEEAGDSVSLKVFMSYNIIGG